MAERKSFPPPPPVTTRCPECGAEVAIVATRWLADHQTGSAERPDPYRTGERCPGSLLAVRPLPRPLTGV
jgi:hypothetical protein